MAYKERPRELSRLAYKWVDMAPYVIVLLVILIITVISLYRSENDYRLNWIQTIKDAYRLDKSMLNYLEETVPLLVMTSEWSQNENRRAYALEAIDEVLRNLEEIQNEVQYSVDEFERKYPSLFEQKTSEGVDWERVKFIVLIMVITFGWPLPFALIFYLHDKLISHKQRKRLKL